MKLILIRHGATRGNIEKRYIGKTEEELCPEGIEVLLGKEYPEADVLYASPQRRCVQTAQIIYPKKEIQVIEDFRECDFGDFEGKNYRELDGNQDYQRWLDSGGKERFPYGEEPKEFQKRCAKAFGRLMEKANDEKRTLALIVHGGTIMSILEKYEASHEFYRWQCGNGCGYVAQWKDGKVLVMGEL